MVITIECLLTLKTSHEIQKVGFKGGNEVKINTPISIDEPFGVKNTKMEITHQGEDEYKLIITSSTLLKIDEQVPFVERIAEYLSYLISIKEHNPHYGISFINVEWLHFFTRKSEEDVSVVGEKISMTDTLNLRDTFCISSSRTYETSSSEWKNIEYIELLKFYYDGLRAEHKKSKYFHWFLILEYLEGTERYKRMFDSNKLFTKDEETKIREVADCMSDNIKKGAILNLLSRTKEFRNRKLLLLLNEIGIKSYKSMGKDTELSEVTIRDITNGRNSLFHKGTTFPNSTLWFHLLPIVREVIGLIGQNAKCLD